MPPLELTLEVVPHARIDVTDVRARAAVEHGNVLDRFAHCLYYSFHTTAGFLDRRLLTRLGPGQVSAYVEALRRIFPEDAGYAHDWLECRRDLDAAQRAVEPRVVVVASRSWAG